VTCYSSSSSQASGSTKDQRRVCRLHVGLSFCKLFYTTPAARPECSRCWVFIC